MRSTILFVATMLTFWGCKKNVKQSPIIKTVLSDKLIIVDNSDLKNSLISLDSTSLTFLKSGQGVNNIKIGSILVSDISSTAPDGFLRKITDISITGGNTVFKTEQASLSEAIQQGESKFSKTFTDLDIIGVDSSGDDISSRQGFSFEFNYSKVLLDGDSNKSTTYDQIKLEGQMKIEATFNFDIKIENNKVSYFTTSIELVNKNKLSAETKIILAKVKKEIVLKTFILKPFTVPVCGVPVPIAKQWIAIVLGVDGSLNAKIMTGVENVNTSTAGIIYQNGSWSNINTQINNFQVLPMTIEGIAKLEPWLQVRYEIRPYGIKSSRIYLAVRGSVIGEVIATPSGVNTSIRWGIKFSGKAQMQIVDKTIIDYEKVFFENEYPIWQSNSKTTPTVTTLSLKLITPTSVETGGNISSDGGENVTERGICWKNTANPSIIDNKIVNGADTGTFIVKLSALKSNSDYFIRAYAINSKGIGYGNEIHFKTNPGTNTISDIEGNVYKTVTIGNQTWMAENLRTTKFNDGTTIPNLKDSVDWLNTNTGAWCYYNNDPNLDLTYGKLYNAYVVFDTKNVCPTGWHIATNEDWDSLMVSIGGVANSVPKLKDNNPDVWYTQSGSNAFGFSARGSGNRYLDGPPSRYRFLHLTIYCNLWNSNKYNSGANYYTQIQHNNPDVVRGYMPNNNGLAIRCIKN